MEDFASGFFGKFEIEEQELRQGKEIAVGILAVALKVSDGFLAVPDGVAWGEDIGFKEGALEEEDVVGIILDEQDVGTSGVQVKPWFF
jgi:hypothetical protein